MDRFQLFFQPKVNIQDEKVIAYEILLRNKEESPSYPTSEMDIILNNQKEHALFLNWFEAEVANCLSLSPGVIFSINFSPKQLLYPETHIFLDHLIKFKEQVIIEITEDKIAFFNPAEFKNIKEIESNILHSFFLIKEKGYTIALDDVGSGRNSLEKVENYLIYIDQIKYSLVKYICKDIQDETNQLFLKAWNSFAKKNHLQFIVEGIEDEQTMEFLREQGIYLQQGYYFGKPSKNIL